MKEKITFLSLAKLLTFTIGVNIISNNIYNARNFLEIVNSFCIALLFIIIIIDLVKPELSYDYFRLSWNLKIVSFCYTFLVNIFILMSALYFSNYYSRENIVNILVLILAATVLVESIYSLVYYLNYDKNSIHLGLSKQDYKFYFIYELLFFLVYLFIASYNYLISNYKNFMQDYKLLVVLIIFVVEVTIYEKLKSDLTK